MTTIGAAARQTGISAATLRKWETRYGFPVPVRGTGGHRWFNPADLEALNQIARRIATGERTSQAISGVLNGQGCDKPATHWARESLPGAAAHALYFLEHNDVAQLDLIMESSLERMGISAFCSDFAIPLIEAVGNRWQQGALPIYAEHIFSAAVQSLLARHVPIHQPARRQCDVRVLLASPVQEVHSLALALFQALLSDAGIACVFLMGGLPASEIAAAALSYRIDVVALSVSAVGSAKGLQTELERLRCLLPGHIAVWVGGAGTGRLPMQPTGVQVMTSLNDGLEQLGAIVRLKAVARGTIKDRKND